MNGILIVALVAGVALLDLFRLRAKNTTLSRAGFLVAALPRALMPVAAAAAVGAWSLIKMYEGVAESGSGGLIPVTGGTIHSIQTLMAGVLAFALTLVVAYLMAASGRASEPNASESGPRLVAVLGIVVMLAALGGAWTATNWTDKIGVGILASASQTGPLPPPPSTYGTYARMSGREMAMKSDRLIMSKWIGLGLCGVVVVLSLLSSFMFSRVWFSSTAWNLARASVAVLVVGAALYSVHLGAGANWLRTMMRG
jgi:hypothetical protein